MRDDFSVPTKTTLAKRAGYLCSNPDCRKTTIGSHEEEDKSTLVGVAAHITAASLGGARYDATQSAEQRVSLANGIWLCVNCSTLIDKDAQKFPVGLLHQWKKDVEEETADALRGRGKAVKREVFAEEEIKETFAEKVNRVKEEKRKELERDTFLRSPEATKEAANQVLIIMARLKEIKETLEDDSIGFSLSHTNSGRDMYGFGFNGKCIRFAWRRRQHYDRDKSILVVSLYEAHGHHGFDYKEKEYKINGYKYMRDMNGTDGWVDYQTKVGFISTADLIEKWMEDFLTYIEYDKN